MAEYLYEMGYDFHFGESEDAMGKMKWVAEKLLN